VSDELKPVAWMYVSPDGTQKYCTPVKSTAWAALPDWTEDPLYSRPPLTRAVQPDAEVERHMQILMPPAAISSDREGEVFLDGWCGGQAYLILNYGTSQSFNDAVTAKTHIEALTAQAKADAENINLKADFIDATINDLANKDQEIEELTAQLDALSGMYSPVWYANRLAEQSAQLARANFDAENLRRCAQGDANIIRAQEAIITRAKEGLSSIWDVADLGSDARSIASTLLPELDATDANQI